MAKKWKIIIFIGVGIAFIVAISAYREIQGQKLLNLIKIKGHHYTVAQVEQLLKSGANANAISWMWIDGGTPVLYYAVRKGDVELVKLLLRYHADPNKPAIHWDTPLQIAMDDGDEEMVKLLVAHHGNINRHNNHSDGSTLLMKVVLEGDLKKVELLLRYGARPDERAKNGWTALRIAEVILGELPVLGSRNIFDRIYPIFMDDIEKFEQEAAKKKLYLQKDSVGTEKRKEYLEIKNLLLSAGAIK
ncbi:MAG: hypothetical protein A2351_08425 [Omnitrophica bacterium RIFOXYB12_FULL_50_7]|nr:MAG: hypothetical protein A2351_08425 [Omnitrophica bacterium RIFOXYB12_FULL_50_7]